MTNRWKLKTSSSNILLVLNTLILVKAEWAKGETDNTVDYTNSIDSTKDENISDQTSIFVGNDEIARYFFSSSQNDNSTILQGINKCLDNFQLITCVKMLLLDRVNDAVGLTEEPSVQDADVLFLNGLVVFKLKNGTNDSAPRDITEDLSLDEEITAKVKRIFWRRSLLVNVLPNVQIEIEPARGKPSDLVCFTYTLRRELEQVRGDDQNQNEGRAREGKKRRLPDERATGKKRTVEGDGVTNKLKTAGSNGATRKQKKGEGEGSTNKKIVGSDKATGRQGEFGGGDEGGDGDGDEDGDGDDDGDDDGDGDGDGDSGSRPGGNRPGGNRPGGNRPGGNRRGGNRRGGHRKKGHHCGGNRGGGNRRGGNRPGGNREGDDQRGDRGRGSRMPSMLMMMPQMLMMGLMPFTLASLKAMVMNAVMINMMALNAAIFMTIRNMVFGPKKGDNVMYVNYGYEKDKQPQTRRPVLIIHSPAAFVKQPPLPRKPSWPAGPPNQWHGSAISSNQNFYHFESAEGPWHQGTQNQGPGGDSWHQETQNQVQGNDPWRQATPNKMYGSGPWQQATQNQVSGGSSQIVHMDNTENPSNSDWQHFNPNGGSTNVYQAENVELTDADVLDASKGDVDVYYAPPQIEHRRRWQENRRRYAPKRVNPFFKTGHRRVGPPIKKHG